MYNEFREPIGDILMRYLSATIAAALLIAATGPGGRRIRVRWFAYPR